MTESLTCFSKPLSRRLRGLAPLPRFALPEREGQLNEMLSEAACGCDGA